MVFDLATDMTGTEIRGRAGVFKGKKEKAWLIPRPNSFIRR